MIIFKFLSSSSGMQSLASRNGCKVILNDLLDICLDVILWSLLSLPVTQQYIEISYREGEGKMAWLDWSPDIYTLFFYVVNLPSPLTHPNRCSSIFFIITSRFWAVQGQWLCLLTNNHHIWNRRTYQLTTAGKQSIWDFLLTGRPRWGKAAVCNKKAAINAEFLNATIAA